MLDLPVETFWHETLWLWFKVLRTLFQLHSGLVAQCWPEWTLKGLSTCTKTMLNWELGQELLMWTVKLLVFTPSMSWKENNLTLNEQIWFCLNTCHGKWTKWTPDLGIEYLSCWRTFEELELLVSDLVFGCLFFCLCETLMFFFLTECYLDQQKLITVYMNWAYCCCC